jgi:hypothetical protein
LKLTIDNLDGNGTIDYSSCIVSGRTFRLTRKLNAPSLLAVALLPAAASLPVPARNGRVVLGDDSGNIFFTGYVATEPALVLAGGGTSGQIYAAELSAVSDEVLLDRLALAQGLSTYGQSAQQTLLSLTGGLGLSTITASLSSALATVGQFIADAGAGWSANAAALVASACGAYRVVNGVLSATPIGTVTHTLSEANGTLSISNLQAALVRVLANDITVCGEVEPSAYVTEFFEGDGTTVLFDLTEDPYFPAASKEKPLVDLFQEPSLKPLLWGKSDNAGYISITAAGLTCSGGIGLDGGTTVAALGKLELGGSLVLEANGVQFGVTTQGVLNGIYNTTINIPSCLAGFEVTQTAGTTAIAPLVLGAVAGPTFNPVAGHMYTLRLRIGSVEMQRVQQGYYYVGDNGLGFAGGAPMGAGANLVFEVQDTTGGVAGAPTVLYSGAVPLLPAVATYAPINSADLVCSIASVDVLQQGTVWVTSTPPGSATIARRIGTTAQGSDCKIERTGKLRFYPASTPQAGEVIAIAYRTSRRSIARLASAASIAAEAKEGLPGTACWMGSVTRPAPRSSVDCENAAQALLAVATSRAAAWQGKYTGWNLEQSGDVWPGDVLAISSTSAGISANLVVREVQIELELTRPALAKYTIDFANDWADALAIKTSSTVPADAWLPLQPETVTPLANLNTLTIPSVTTSQINVSANATPPSGGGFEVRRRDWSFGPGTNSDLVLRSPVPNFIIPREAAMEQYYIRMYDGSTPPNYSRFSSAAFVNLPL